MWQSLLVYNACPQPQTEATVLVSPSLLQIDTFGKWCRCLHNVCYLKLKKPRYLDKCRLSALADSTEQYKPFWAWKFLDRMDSKTSCMTPAPAAQKLLRPNKVLMHRKYFPSTLSLYTGTAIISHSNEAWYCCCKNTVTALLLFSQIDLSSHFLSAIVWYD